MEPEIDMPTMQPETWKRYIRGSFSPRKGQRDLFKIAATRSLRHDQVNILKAVLPTGYGKTLAGMGTYIILREQEAVNRLLVLVPNDQLRQQWSTNAEKNAAKLGATLTGALQLDDVKAAFRYHQTNNAEIFVATYQQVIFDSRSWINELLASGHWMVIFDEFHHLATDKAWGQCASRFINDRLCRIALMLSATPIRTDKRLTIGGGFVKQGKEWILDPDVCVTLAAALDEEAIRKVKAHIHHYFVDVLPDGATEPIRVTTEMLRKEEITDFNNYEVRRKLRYVDEYLSKALLDAVSIYEARNLQHPDQHQILVFAMTCAHAQAVAQQFNIIAGPAFADWIGVTRPDHENDAILKRYQANQLPCLVQVDKAGEGFDNDRASILVFLHLIRSGSKLIQQVGRGLRRNCKIPFDDDWCQVSASADTELAEYIRELEIELGMEEKKKKNGNDDPWPLFQDLVDVDAEYDRLELIHYQNRDAEMEAIFAMAQAAGAPPELEGMNLEWLRRLVKQVRGAGASVNEPSNPFADETAKRRSHQQDVDKIVGTFAGKIVSLYAKQNGIAFPKELLGNIKQQVHARWIRVTKVGHSEMMADEFKAKFYWVREEYEKMRTLREMPAWIRLS